MNKRIAYREASSYAATRGVLIDCPACNAPMLVDLWPDRTEAPPEYVSDICGRCGANVALEIEWYISPEIDALRLVGVS